MFGITKLTEEEQAEYTKKRRIKFLEGELDKEAALRSKSLSKCEVYSEELSGIKGSK